MSSVIYLDYQATTPLAPEAAAAMRPWLEEKFANPHSPHRLGREAAAAVEYSRQSILDALGCAGQANLVFTSGATEAANMAIQGTMLRSGQTRRKIVTIATEHACVRDTALWLGSHGYDCVILPVGADGLVILEQAEQAIDENTALVAAMLVNNEIGVIQPISELAKMAHAKGALFFCDAVQGFGRVPLPSASCDMIALSAHKIYGPKGIGALWMRKGIALEPLLHGGGQEGGIRSGTLSPALCAGFGAAVSALSTHRQSDENHVAALAALGEHALPEWTFNGSRTERYLGNMNIRRKNLDASRLISEMREVAFSAGSACASGSGRPSHVLSALGLSDMDARSSIRIGFGRYTDMEEMRRALELIQAGARRQGVIA